MKFVAVMDKIFVKELVVKEHVTEGGIVLTDDAAQKQEPQKCGIVVSFGADVPYDLNVGDLLVFHQRAGQAMILDKTIYRIVKADEVYGILRDDDVISEPLYSCSDKCCDEGECTCESESLPNNGGEGYKTPPERVYQGASLYGIASPYIPEKYDGDK